MLVVEKEATFRSLLAANVVNRLGPCILVTVCQRSAEPKQQPAKRIIIRARVIRMSVLVSLYNDLRNCSVLIRRMRWMRRMALPDKSMTVPSAGLKNGRWHLGAALISQQTGLSHMLQCHHIKSLRTR